MLSESQLDSLETRTMDCLDCHNRPSHDYAAPQNFIDEKMATGKISHRYYQALSWCNDCFKSGISY